MSVKQPSSVIVESERANPLQSVAIVGGAIVVALFVACLLVLFVLYG